MQQLDFFSPQSGTIALEDVFEAYFECRRNKRRTYNALAFEMRFEENLIELWRSLNEGTYRVGRSLAFIVRKPVLREIFAADFRDRVVHHLVIRKLMPLFEQAFLPDSYSCRKGKGSLYGIRRVYAYLRACSGGFHQDCYVMRLDIQSFFMQIHQDILYRKLEAFIRQNYKAADKRILLRLVHQIVFNQPQKNCLRRGSCHDWLMLPRSKSLFHVSHCRGLPIGNLSSQVFANFYLNELDHFVAAHPGVYYGRYVDDMVLIHPQKASLLSLRRDIEAFLKTNTGLKIHPYKFALQHYAKGFPFIGAFIKPHRMYASRRLKHVFLERLTEFARCHKRTPGWVKHIECVLNSYFGFLRHYQTFRLRLKGWNILARTGKYALVSNTDMTKARFFQMPARKTPLVIKDHERSLL